MILWCNRFSCEPPNNVYFSKCAICHYLLHLEKVPVGPEFNREVCPETTVSTRTGFAVEFDPVDRQARQIDVGYSTLANEIVLVVFVLFVVILLRVAAVAHSPSSPFGILLQISQS